MICVIQMEEKFLVSVDDKDKDDVWLSNLSGEHWSVSGSNQAGASLKKCQLLGTIFLHLEHRGNEDDSNCVEAVWHVLIIKLLLFISESAQYQR